MPPVAYILKHSWSFLQVFPIWTKWLKFEILANTLLITIKLL